MNEAISAPPVFLSKMVLSYQLAASLRIRNSYDWHQRVWECFPGRDGANRDFLTRLDDKDGEYRLLILSPAPPTCPPWCPPEALESKPIPTTYFAHTRYTFQLRANPTKKVVNPAKPKVLKPDGRIDRNRNSRRVPLVAPDELRAWLARKASDHGFAAGNDSPLWQPVFQERRRVRASLRRGLPRRALPDEPGGIPKNLVWPHGRTGPRKNHPGYWLRQGIRPRPAGHCAVTVK